MKENKMKKTLLIALLLIVGCSKPIDLDTLIEEDGLKYHPETKELYSGKVFSNYMGGNKKLDGSYKDGKFDGLFTLWHENGQKKREDTYKDGEVFPLECWDEDGNIKDCNLIGYF